MNAPAQIAAAALAALVVQALIAAVEVPRTRAQATRTSHRRLVVAVEEAVQVETVESRTVGAQAQRVNKIRHRQRSRIRRTAVAVVLDVHPPPRLSVLRGEQKLFLVKITFQSIILLPSNNVAKKPTDILTLCCSIAIHKLSSNIYSYNV